MAADRPTLPHELREKKKRGLEKGLPILEATGLEIVEIDIGRARVRMPLARNANHVGTLYAGSLFVLSEVTGAALISASFDTKRYHPIVKEMSIRYRRPARTDVTASATLSMAQIDDLVARAEREGKVDHEWECELVDDEGTVVAVTRNVFQLRRGSSQSARS